MRIEVVEKNGVTLGALSNIYVALLGEGTDVWRPVEAENLGNGLYRILDQPYEPANETWQFAPGDLVQCEVIHLSEGPVLAATLRVRNPETPTGSPDRP